MSQQSIQPIQAENLSPEEFRFVKAQQAIYNLCQAIEQDRALKAQLQATETPESFLKIAAENGYQFTASDLQIAMRWSLEKAELDSDEFDDYELSEEDLEMVAGGTAPRGAMTNNSYWHQTGILVDNQCFHLNYQSSEMRELLKDAIKKFEKWEYRGNGELRVIDTDGIFGDQIFNNMIDNGAYTWSLDSINTSIYEIIYG